VDFVPLSTRDINAACESYGTMLGLRRSVHVPGRNYAAGFETDNVTICIVDGEKMGTGHHVQTIALALRVDDVAAADRSEVSVGGEVGRLLERDTVTRVVGRCPAPRGVLSGKKGGRHAAAYLNARHEEQS
jgi:predicted enzyme related to lactoylglutathione lyase